MIVGLFGLRFDDGFANQKPSFVTNILVTVNKVAVALL
jgi:hypothetical protein